MSLLAFLVLAFVPALAVGAEATLTETMTVSDGDVGLSEAVAALAAAIAGWGGKVGLDRYRGRNGNGDFKAALARHEELRAESDKHLHERITKLREEMQEGFNRQGAELSRVSSDVAYLRGRMERGDG